MLLKSLNGELVSPLESLMITFLNLSVYCAETTIFFKKEKETVGGKKFLGEKAENDLSGSPEMLSSISSSLAHIPERKALR